MILSLEHVFMLHPAFLPLLTLAIRVAHVAGMLALKCGPAVESFLISLLLVLAV